MAQKNVRANEQTIDKQSPSFVCRESKKSFTVSHSTYYLGTRNKYDYDCVIALRVGR